MKLSAPDEDTKNGSESADENDAEDAKDDADEEEAEEIQTSDTDADLAEEIVEDWRNRPGDSDRYLKAMKQRWEIQKNKRNKDIKI